MQALRLMDAVSLGGQAPPAGVIPGTPYRFEAAHGGFGFGLIGGPAHRLDLVFGSGKSGMAFASILGNSTMAEAHMSYFPAQKTWFITPGQGRIPPSELGNITQGAAARECFPCHTVAMPGHSLMPEKPFLGVGCESCHGPGGRHVDAMRANPASDPQMPDLSSASSSAIVALCGRCHRTQREVVSEHLSRGNSDLFQAFGIEESRCYRESRGQLSCVTCHDPHTNVDTTESHYNAVCLSCHSQPGGRPSAAFHSARPGLPPSHVSLSFDAAACPVNRTRDCVKCHMPERAEPLFPGSPRRIADHLIKVWP